MAADSSWGEVRWHEPQSNPPSHDSIMATRTLLAGTRTVTAEAREERHTRLMEPYLRIDHSVHAPQPNTYIRGPVNRLDDTRSFPESRYPSDHTQKALYGQQNALLTSHIGGVDGARTGSMSGQIDQSRRTSELQPISDARISSGELLELLFSDSRKFPLVASELPICGLAKQSLPIQTFQALVHPID